MKGKQKHTAAHDWACRPLALTPAAGRCTAVPYRKPHLGCGQVHLCQRPPQGCLAHGTTQLQVLHDNEAAAPVRVQAHMVHLGHPHTAGVCGVRQV
jgi:hypothetical protein